MSCVKQDLIKSYAVRFIFSQSCSEVASGIFSNRRVSLRFYTVNASITSHLHISKLFLSLNFTTSIFNGCGFMDFTIDVLSSSIFSIDSSKTMRKKNGVRSRRVFEMIYSTKFDSLRNPNAVLRLTHDLTNSPNAAPKSIHYFSQITTNTFGIDTGSHDEPGML